MQLTLPLDGLDRYDESPRLKAFKQERLEFRQAMDDLMDDDIVEINDVWDQVVETFDIPVKEWGRYPSDEVVDAQYNAADLEYYTYVYHQASKFLLWQSFDKHAYDRDEEELVDFWDNFMSDLERYSVPHLKQESNYAIQSNG